MARVTNNEYLRRHHLLKPLRNDHRRLVFGVLSPNQQWDLHRYYLTGSTNADEKLLLERDDLRQEAPSLPQRAGKAFAKLERLYNQAEARTGNDELKFCRVVLSFIPARVIKNRKVKVLPLATPEPNLKAIARALMALAEEAA